jgi:hypothetical protein
MIADGHATDDEPAILDAVTQQLRFRSDAGVRADRDDIEGAAKGRADGAVAADLRSHGPVIEAH